MNGYHMKEQYSHLFCTMVKRTHKLHSDRVRSEPVNPNSENQSQRRVSSPGRNGTFCFLKRTTGSVPTSRLPEHLDRLIKFGIKPNHLTISNKKFAFLVGGE